MEKKIRIILTGATGMVGEGVLHECLLHDAVASVLVIGRKSSGIDHPKLKELLVPNLTDLSTGTNHLSGYDACFFCAGISSLGMKETEYRQVTYDLTIGFAKTLSSLNPDMTFCYISGAGTDSSEKGKLMWARVKGKTENDLMKLPFKSVYAFRPAFMKPTPGLKNTISFYKYILWLYPLVHPLFPAYFGTLKGLGIAMIHCALDGFEKRVLEAKDILVLEEKEP
jgi:hypothetical protein